MLGYTELVLSLVQFAVVQLLNVVVLRKQFCVALKE